MLPSPPAGPVPPNSLPPPVAAALRSRSRRKPFVRTLLLPRSDSRALLPRSQRTLLRDLVVVVLVVVLVGLLTAASTVLLP